MTISNDAKKKNIAGLIAKLNKGKTLTRAELQQIEEFEAEQNRKETTFDISTTEAAAFFGVTMKTIAAWTKAGMPKVSYATYNLKACFDWWQKEINTGNEEYDETLTKARRDYWKAKAEREQMACEKEKGNLIDRDEIITEWCKRVGEVKTGMLSLDKALPVLCEMKPAEEIRKIIKDYTIQLLQAYSRSGKFCETKKKK